MNWYKIMTSSSSSNFWVSPNGEMIGVNTSIGENHSTVGYKICVNDLKKDKESVKAFNIYDILFKAGYIRIYSHQYNTHIDCQKKPTEKQVESISQYFKNNKNSVYELTLLIGSKRSSINRDSIKEIEKILRGKVVENKSIVHNVRNNPLFFEPQNEPI